MKIKRSDLGRFALLLLSLESRKVIAGRTKLQKMVYLANECGWNAVRDYVFYQYGPYSKWLSLELDNLKNIGLVDEKTEETRSERTVYLYSLTSKGLSILESILKELEEPKLLEKTRGLLRQLTKYESDELEIMASLLYISRDKDLISRDKDLNMDDVVKTTLRLKPRFTEEQIRKHLNVFDLIERFRKLPA